MNRVRLLIIFFIIACSDSTIILKSYLFENKWLTIKLYSKVYLQNIQIYNESKLLLTIPIHSENDHFSFPFNWKSRKNYKLLLLTENNQKKITLRSPQINSNITAKIAIPFGQSADKIGSSLEKQTLFSDSIYSHLGLSFPSENRDTISVRISSDYAILNHVKQLNFKFYPKKFDKRFDIFFYLNPSLKGSQSFNISIRKNKKRIINSSILLHFISSDSLVANINILDHKTPVDANGMISPFDKLNHFFLEDKILYKIRSIFSNSLNFSNINKPFSYYRIDLENNFNTEMLILAEVDIQNERNGKTDPAFIPSDWKQSGFSTLSRSSILLPSNQKESILLPIYINRQLISSGSYLANIKLYILGQKKAFYEHKQKIFINYKEHSRIIFFAFFILIALVGIFRLVQIFPKTIESFSLKISVTISIFAAIHFLLNFFITFLDYSILAVLGPFKVFISSFVTECLSYCILISLYILYPKRGVIAVKLLTSFVLAITLSGGFYFFSIFTLGLNILFLEFLFNRFYSKSSFFLFALLLSISDALITYYNIVEFQVLYNIFYADWYIYIYLLLIGFTYTFIGSYLGKHLGIYLRRINA